MKFAAHRLFAAVGAGHVSASTADVRLAVTPVQKVVQILQSMLEKGKKEKHEEQVQFSAYQQWCGDVIDEKDQAVVHAEEQIEHLKADIQAEETEADELSLKVGELEGNIATWQGDLKAAANVRSVERATYLEEHKEYSEAINAIERAVQVLRQRATGEKAQADALLQTIRAWDKVPTKSKAVIDAFLSYDPPEADGYEFRSQGIVDMLEKLRDKFVTERSDLEQKEMNQKHAHELLRQELNDSIRNAEDSVTSKTQRKAKAMQSAAGKKGDLEDTSSAKADDEAFLKDTKANCAQKANDFQDRQKLRADEIVAIEKAIEILSSDDVSGAAEKHLPSLLQHGKQSFAQLRSGTVAAKSPNQIRVAAYLKAQAEKLGSHVLSVLSERATADPFAKVKAMIKDLITKLQEEAGEEAEHKQWCDTELAENEKVRTSRTSSVDSLSSQIDQLQSSISKTAQDITELTKQVADLDKDVAERTQLRQQTKAKNEMTIKDSQEAQTAVKRAVEVLQEFYARAGEATALVQGAAQQPESFDAPYQGQGGESGGVIGMLEVIQSDFARLESDTTAAEVTEQQDYDKFMSDSAVLKTEMTKDVEHKQSTKGREEQDLVEAQNDLASTQKELDAALTYYEQLKSSCINTGDSYEEREARRKEEIESLQEALRILNGEDLELVQHF
jgi:hypothetical protein